MCSGGISGRSNARLWITLSRNWSRVASEIGVSILLLSLVLTVVDDGDDGLVLRQLIT